MRSGRLKALDDVVMKEMSACEFRENTFFLIVRLVRICLQAGPRGRTKLTMMTLCA